MRGNAAVPASLPEPDDNHIAAVRQVSAGVEIELASSRAFPITDALPVLTIGDRQYRLSRFVPGANNRIVFLLKSAEYAGISAGAKVSLRIGGIHPWTFGTLHAQR
jgi:hypothetical protein